MTRPEPRRRTAFSRFKASPDVPDDLILKPSDDGYWDAAEQRVALRVTCRSCGDPRRVALLGLDTFEGAGDEPWSEGLVDFSPGKTSVTAVCRNGHTISLRLDLLNAQLRALRDQVGIGGRRVVDVAM